MEYNAVTRPKHYNSYSVEVIDAIEDVLHAKGEAYELSEGQCFFLGNVIKYLLRSPFKNGLEDLKKAQFYLKRVIDLPDPNFAGFIGDVVAETMVEDNGHLWGGIYTEKGLALQVFSDLEDLSFEQDTVGELPHTCFCHMVDTYYILTMNSPVLTQYEQLGWAYAMLVKAIASYEVTQAE